MTTLVYVILGIIIGALLLIALIFKASWRVAEPDEALIISGFRTSQRPDGVGESMGFRIVTGRGRLVAPGITKVRRLSLEAHESEIDVPCVSQQKIRVDSARRRSSTRSATTIARSRTRRDGSSIDPPRSSRARCRTSSSAICARSPGSMTIEDMISDQDKFAQQVRDRCSQEMESFGLVIDSFQIQAITSPSNYIENLAAPHQAEVERNARIARANAERDAVGQEQMAQAMMARVAARHQHQEGRLPGRGRHRDPARGAAGSALGGQSAPGRRHRADPCRGVAGRAEGTAVAGRCPQACRR